MWWVAVMTIKIQNNFMQFMTRILKVKTLIILVFSCAMLINPSVAHLCTDGQLPLQSNQTTTNIQKQIVTSSDTKTSTQKNIPEETCTHKGHCCSHFLAYKQQNLLIATKPSLHENLSFKKEHIPRNFISNIFKPPKHPLV